MKIIPYILVLLIVSGLLVFYQTTPYMSLNQGIDTVYIGDDYLDPGATIKIGQEIYEMTSTHIIDTSLLGKKTITYSYEHENKVYQITRSVMVIESDTFKMTLNPGMDTIKIGERWVDAGVSTTHDVDVEVISSFNRLRVGTYEITYRVMYLNTIYEITRYVTVVS
jgi:hypothetical protein